MIPISKYYTAGTLVGRFFAVSKQIETVPDVGMSIGLPSQHAHSLSESYKVLITPAIRLDILLQLNNELETIKSQLRLLGVDPDA